MIHDARFLNLWQKSTPFTLENLSNVPAIAPRGTFFTCLDEKSSYDGIKLAPSARKYFGIQFAGWYFVYNTMTFGWRSSAVLCQHTGLLVTSVLRSYSISCIQYLDDRFLAEWLGTKTPLCTKYRRAEVAVTYAMALMHSVGYTFSLKKCSFHPNTSGVFLGLEVDTSAQKFSIPVAKLEAFAALREDILAMKLVPLRTLQRLTGKACSFILCVPGAKLYCRELNRAIATNGAVPMYEALKEEILFWRFLDTFSEWKPWRSERHVQISIHTDSSGHAWGVHSALGSFRDYWRESALAPPIHIKEGLAVLNALLALKGQLQDSTVDLLCDNQAFVKAFNAEGSKDRQMTEVVRQVFNAANDINCNIQITYINTKLNNADSPSRVLSSSDCSLADHLWQLVDRQFGPHTWDLMALDSNTPVGRDGTQLPHFTPFPSPNTSGVNVLAQKLSENEMYYCFPPFVMLPIILRFLRDEKALSNLKFTIVAPKLDPLPHWWPTLSTGSTKQLKLASKGDVKCLKVPTKAGFVLSEKPIFYDLYAFHFA